MGWDEWANLAKSQIHTGQTKHLYIHTSQITKLILLFMCVCVFLQSGVFFFKQAGVVNYRAQRIKAAQMFTSKKFKH